MALFGRRRAPSSSSAPAASSGPIEQVRDRVVEAGDPIPAGLKIAAGFSWRVIVVLAAIAVVIFLVLQVVDVAVPFLIALILSALLVPLSSFLQRHGFPKWLAIIGSWVVVLAALGALGTVVALQIHYDLPSLQRNIRHTVSQAQQFIDSQPFGLTAKQINQYVDKGVAYVQSHSSALTSGFREAGTGLVHALEGLFIVILTTLFILVDGPRIWRWVVRLFPRAAHRRIDAAGHAGWRTLTSFIRVQLVVAVTDAIGIGLGSFLFGVPLAVPIAVIVFLGAFVPVVGAIVAGIVAVLIALVFNGWVVALIVLGIVLFVQQLESHVLHPFLTGGAVRVHPLGIVLGVTAGSAIAGVAGAFFAVPFIATVNSMIVAARHVDPDEITGAGHDPDRRERETSSERRGFLGRLVRH